MGLAGLLALTLLSPIQLAAAEPSQEGSAATAGETTGQPEILPPDLNTVDLSTALNVVHSGEYSDEYEFAGGFGIMTIGREPLNVRGTDGHWTPVSLSATKQADGAWVAKQHPLHPVFPGTLGRGAALTVSDADYAVQFFLKDARASAAALDKTHSESVANSKVTYAGAFENVDLQYSLTNGSVKETLVLSARPTGEASWSWTIVAPGLNLERTEYGGIQFVDPAGAVRFTMPQPIMWDSSAVPGVQEAADKVLDWSLKQQANGSWAFTITADRAWLASPDRVYPVFVDPTASYGDTSIVSYKNDGATRTDGVLVGNSRSGGVNTYWRAQATYGYSALDNKQILDANLYGDQMYEGTTTSFTGSVSKPSTYTCTGYSCSLTQLSTWAISGSGTASSTALSKQISDWVNANQWGRKLTLRGQESSGVYTYKWLNTSLAVSYKAFPAITAVSPANGATTSAAPTLQVTATDPSSSGLSYRYVFGPATATTAALINAATVYDSGWVQEADFQVPAGNLAHGTTYKYYLQVRDGYDSEELLARGQDPDLYFGTHDVRPSAVYSLTTAPNIAPDAPTALTVSPWVTDSEQAPAAGSTTAFSATTNDSESDDVTTTFEVHDSDTVSSSTLKLTCVAGTVSSGATAACGSEQKLVDGSYYVRARSHDEGVNGPWSEWLAMTVNPLTLAPVVAAASRYYAQAASVLDTRDGTGGYPVGPLQPGWHPIAVGAVDGLPASGITAVAVTLTAIAPSAAGTIHADANGAAVPNESTSYLDYPAATGTAAYRTSAILPVGSDGKIQVDLTSPTDLVIDVQGYYSASSGGGAGYVPLPLAAVADTSTGLGGVPVQQLSAGDVLAIQITGANQVPLDASSVVLSVTASNASSAEGSLAIYPDGAPVPTRTWDWNAVANNWTVTVPLPASGIVDVSVTSGELVDVQLAVQGYFTASSTTSSGAFTPLVARLFDSEAESFVLGAGELTSIPIVGVQGIPAAETGISAVALRLSVPSGSGAAGLVQVYPEEAVAPGGEDVVEPSNAGTPPNGYVIVPAGANGILNVFNSSDGPVSFVVEVEGWFQGESAATISCPGLHDGDWAAAPSSSAFDCTVTAVPALTADGVLHLALDQIPLPDVPLSTSASTVANVTIPGGAGAHEISAVVASEVTRLVANSSFSFGSGVWSDVALVPNLSDGAVTYGNDALTLSAASDGAPFALGTTFRYTLSVNADGSSPALVTPWSFDELVIDAGTLTVGATYYWKVEARGPSNVDGSAVQLTSPWWSFTTTATQVAPMQTPSSVLCTGYTACNSNFNDSNNVPFPGKQFSGYWGAAGDHNCTNYVAYMLYTQLKLDPATSDSKAARYNLTTAAMPWWLHHVHGPTFGDGIEAPAYIDSKPSKGAVAWWTYWKDGVRRGHVAWVEAAPTGNLVTVSEDNFGGNFYWKKYDKTKATIKFIHVKYNIPWLAKPTFTSSLSTTVTGGPYTYSAPLIAVGATLTAHHSGTTSEDGALAYEWRVGGKRVGTGSTFTVRAQDLGMSIAVLATAREGYRTNWKLSSARTVVPRPFNSVSVDIVSLPAPNVYQAVPEVSPSNVTGLKKSYQWYIDGLKKSTATGATYQVLASEHGKRISVKVTVTAPGYEKVTKTASITG